MVMCDMSNFSINDNNPLYNMVELARAQISPLRLNLLYMQDLMNNPINPFAYTMQGNILRASVEVTERLTRNYKKPEFHINNIKIDEKEYQIELEIEHSKPFCNLLHFSKKGYPKKLPKIIVVAPMAGHHATLLKGTVLELLPFFDVYITDWIDASQVPLIYGEFDFDDYIDYLIEFFELFTDQISVIAVCQPTVPVLAAISIMSEQNSKHIPKSMVLMGGPVDARENPTTVSEFASEHKIKWFEQYVITTVPNNYPGAGRKVYPGFLQIAGFMSLNWQRHMNSYLDLFQNLVNHDENKVAIHKKFYDEYLSVMDLPAEFYLQTIREVFQKYSLAKGKLKSRGRDANADNITKTALLGIEGENDDIAAVGQTLAALELCENIPTAKKHYHLQKGVGHYGVFTGSKFKLHIVPVIKDFVYKYAK